MAPIGHNIMHAHWEHWNTMLLSKQFRPKCGKTKRVPDTHTHTDKNVIFVRACVRACVTQLRCELDRWAPLTQSLTTLHHHQWKTWLHGIGDWFLEEKKITTNKILFLPMSENLGNKLKFKNYYNYNTTNIRRNYYYYYYCCCCCWYCLLFNNSGWVVY